MIPKNFKIITERFILRVPSEADFSSIFSTAKYPGFHDGMLWEPPKTLEELIPPLKGNLKAWEDGRGYGFTIEEKESQKFLGRISIRKTEEQDLWSVGYWTHPEQQRKGVMTEALAGILKFGFEDLSATRIEACHALWNKASEKVLKNNGFTFVEYLEKGFQKKGKWVEENKLAISAEVWNQHL